MPPRDTEEGRSLNVGLIGCGRITQLVHLAALRRLPGIHLVALAEADPQRRAEAGRQVPNAVPYADYTELLKDANVEAVIICLPSAMHAEAAKAALRLGKHVYLEKPVATDLGDAESLLAVWRATGLVGMMGFNYRFHHLYRAARTCILSNQLGDLVAARSVFSTAQQPLPAWKRTRQGGGGALLDLASHHIDLIYFLFGQEIRDAVATLRSQRTEDDTAILSLRLRNGLLVQSFFSTNAVEEDRFEIYGTAGKLTVDRYASSVVEIAPPTRQFARLKRLAWDLRSLMVRGGLLRTLTFPQREASYDLALAHFMNAVRARRPAAPDFWDGYRSLAVVSAAEESARTGRGVLLDAPQESPAH